MIGRATLRDDIQWFVWDAETDDKGLPAVIRQADTLDAAIRGLID